MSELSDRLFAEFDARKVGRGLQCRVDGRNIRVANRIDGAYVLTEEGHALLNSTEVVEVTPEEQVVVEPPPEEDKKPVTKKKTTKKKTAKKPAGIASATASDDSEGSDFDGGMPPLDNLADD